MPQVPKPASFPFALSLWSKSLWHQVSLFPQHSSTTHFVSSRCCTAQTTSPPEKDQVVDSKGDLFHCFIKYSVIWFYISQNVLSRIHIHGTTLRLLLSLLVVEHSKFFPDKSLLFSSGEGNILWKTPAPHEDQPCGGRSQRRGVRREVRRLLLKVKA